MADYAVVAAGAVTAILPSGFAFTSNGIQYPANWLDLTSAAERNAVNIFNVAYVGSQGDQRFYTSVTTGPVISASTVTYTWVNTARSLAVTKAAKLQDLNAYALIRDTNGTTFGGFPIFTTDHYKILYAIYNQRATAGVQASFNLPDSLGVFHTLTVANMQNLYTAAAVYVGAVLNNQNTHSTAINALSDSASVIAYDFTTGWPT